jgi:oxygen-dependent protoporphyrinogen oxidase
VGRVIAVIGGGISGLGAARVLAGAQPASKLDQTGKHGASGVRTGGATKGGRGDLEILLLEADDRFGGKIRSGEFRGRPIDLGPDNFLTRNPSAADMSDILGIGEDLVAPATSSASVVARGRLRPMPTGLILGLPPDLLALARSHIVSVRGLARAALDLVPVGESIAASSLGLGHDPSLGRLPTSTLEGREWSAGSILRHRLGREIVDRLVDPLLGGINAGGVDQLSLTVVAPEVARALVGEKSVTRALRLLARRTRAQSATKRASSRPFFLGMRGGLGRIVDELTADLQNRGVELQAGTAVTALRKTRDRFELETSAGTVVADGVIMAAPGHVAARLLVDTAPVTAAELGSIPHSSVVLLTFAFASSAVPGLPPGSGFLVPRCEGRLITGCTFMSAKWPPTAAPGELVIRASTGRYGDDRSATMSDEELAKAVLGELKELLGISAPPLEGMVQRWLRAFPQYLPGHLRKIERALAALRDLPPLGLAGPSLGGIGIPACLTSGERAAVEVLDRLGA